MNLNRAVAALTLLTALLAPMPAAAHEVPDDVTMRIYLKPANGKMQVLVRVPVNALIDFLFPTLGDTNFLDLPETNRQTADAARVWVADMLTIYEGDRQLARPLVLKTIVSRDSDRSFATYNEALAHVNGPPLPGSALVAWDRAVLDVLLETPIRSGRSDFSLVPRFGRLGVRVNNNVGFLPVGGGQRNFVYEGDPERFRLDPAPADAALHFAQLGLFHILGETDHLLFLFCLILLFGSFRALIPFVAAFSAAHSASLLASALIPGPGPVWLPRVVGTLMALFVIYVGLECVVPATLERYRPLVAVSGGLVFGSGFWFFLEPALQFGGNHPIISALSFNAGIEAGQLLALALLVPAVGLFFRFASNRRLWTMIFAGLAAHIAWHRMTERAFTLSRVPIEWPSPEVWTAILVAGTIGLISTFTRRRKEVPQL
jgi:hypothetical protein